MIGTTRVDSRPPPHAAALAAVAPADSTRQVPIAVLFRIPKLAASNAAFDEAGQFAAATPRRQGEWFMEHTDEEKH